MFLLKDEIANADIVLVDNNGNCGIFGSANTDQALSLESLGIITRGAFLSAGTVGPGGSSPLSGAIVIPVDGISGIPYSLPSLPTVTSPSAPISVTTTAVQWANSGATSTLTVQYNIW